MLYCAPTYSIRSHRVTFPHPLPKAVVHSICKPESIIQSYWNYKSPVFSSSRIHVSSEGIVSIFRRISLSACPLQVNRGERRSVEGMGCTRRVPFDPVQEEGVRCRRIIITRACAIRPEFTGNRRLVPVYHSMVRTSAPPSVIHTVCSY